MNRKQRVFLVLTVLFSVLLCLAAVATASLLGTWLPLRGGAADLGEGIAAVILVVLYVAAAAAAALFAVVVILVSLPLRHAEKVAARRAALVLRVAAAVLFAADAVSFALVLLLP